MKDDVDELVDDDKLGADEHVFLAMKRPLLLNSLILRVFVPRSVASEADSARCRKNRGDSVLLMLRRGSGHVRGRLFVGVRLQIVGVLLRRQSYTVELEQVLRRTLFSFACTRGTGSPSTQKRRGCRAAPAAP